MTIMIAYDTQPHADWACGSRQILRIVRGGLIRPSMRLGVEEGRRRTGRGPRNEEQDRRNGFYEGDGMPGHHRGAGFADAGGGGAARVAVGCRAPSESLIKQRTRKVRHACNSTA